MTTFLVAPPSGQSQTWLTDQPAASLFQSAAIYTCYLDQWERIYCDWTVSCPVCLLRRSVDYLRYFQRLCSWTVSLQNLFCKSILFSSVYLLQDKRFKITEDGENIHEMQICASEISNRRQTEQNRQKETKTWAESLEFLFFPDSQTGSEHQIKSDCFVLRENWLWSVC